MWLLKSNHILLRARFHYNVQYGLKNVSISYGCVTKQLLILYSTRIFFIGKYSYNQTFGTGIIKYSLFERKTLIYVQQWDYLQTKCYSTMRTGSVVNHQNVSPLLLSLSTIAPHHRRLCSKGWICPHVAYFVYVYLCGWMICLRMCVVNQESICNIDSMELLCFICENSYIVYVLCILFTIIWAIGWLNFLWESIAYWFQKLDSVIDEHAEATHNVCFVELRIGFFLLSSSLSLSLEKVVKVGTSRRKITRKMEYFGCNYSVLWY